MISPLDVLLVVNELNTSQFTEAMAEGEGQTARLARAVMERPSVARVSRSGDRDTTKGGSPTGDRDTTTNRYTIGPDPDAPRVVPAPRSPSNGITARDDFFLSHTADSPELDDELFDLLAEDVETE